MKKIIFYIITITLVSCSNNSNNNTQSNSIIPSETNHTAASTTTTSFAEPQLTATFNNQPLAMVGKIMQQCDSENNCNSTITVKQKNTDRDNMYELVVEINHKIEAGTYLIQRNYLGTFIDAVNLITKGEGDSKYTTPTTYKQKGGSITLTAVTNKLVNGSFSLIVYNIADTNLTQTIHGTIKGLPIKALGE